MKELPFERAIRLGQYIVETEATVRAAAARFGVSKSTVHKDVSERLKMVEPTLAAAVTRVLEKNKAERHIRGGMATRLKYAGAKHLHPMPTRTT